MGEKLKREKAKKQTTGILFLDQILGGGLPKKSIVCFLADSLSGADMFLYQFSSTRKTYYITTTKRPEDVTRVMKELGLATEYIKFIAADEAKYMLGRVLENIQKGGEPVNIIIDAFSFYLDASPKVEKIRKLIDFIRDVTLQTDSITFLFVYKGTHPKDLENLVLNASDVIFDVESHVSGERHETILSIPKIRGMTPIGRIKVTLGERIKIDTTRDIA